MASSRRLPASYNTSTYGGAGLGRDYTSLSAWEADTDIDLVTATNGEVLECYDDEDFEDYVTLGDATTDADYFRVIKPVDGEGHDGTPNNGVNFTESIITVFRIRESYSQIHDIIGIRTGTDVGSIYAFQASAGSSSSNIAFIGCIGKATNDGLGEAYAFRLENYDSNISLVINCLAYDCKTYGFDAILTLAHPGTVYAYNCVSINAGSQGFRCADATVTFICKNCISVDSGSDDYHQTTNTTCLDTTDDITFVNAGIDDYHLDSSTTDGIDDGTDLSSDGSYAFDDDIDGDSRRVGSWSIGFDEPVGLQFEKSISESASADDAFAAQVQANPSISESASADDAFMHNRPEQEESASANDAFVSNIEGQEAISESASADDTFTALDGYEDDQAESVSADDTFASTVTRATTTMVISGDSSCSVGDILRMKNGSADEWIEVTASGAKPVYEVERDKAGDYGAGELPAWPKGTAVVNYGQAGDGGIYMTSSEPNAPYISVWTHAGSPWDTITTHVKLGNLNGYLGVASDLFGIGIGSIGANQANMLYDPTNGMRLRVNTTDMIVLDNAGNAYIASTLTIGGSSGVLASTVDGWKHASDATKIDGGDIYARTVRAASIYANDITADELTTGAFVTASANITNAIITEGHLGTAIVTNAKIGTAAVDTLEIAGNAVTIPASDFSSSSGNCTGSYQEVLDAVLTSEGSPVTIVFSLMVENPGAGGHYFSVKFTYDDGSETTIAEDTWEPVYTGGSKIVSFAYAHTPGSGSIEYRIYVKQDDGAPFDLDYAERSITIIETQR
jgi:hypothetical protein